MGMDEQKNGQELPEEPEKKEKQQEIPTRSMMLMIVAGAYLLYTGYTLCKNVLAGQDGASWGFFAAGAAFIVIGAGMLFYGIKCYNDRSKAKRLAEEAEEAAAAEMPEEETEE